MHPRVPSAIPGEREEACVQGEVISSALGLCWRALFRPNAV